ncbi:helix-turn-helix domain-containing protein [Streptomyces sp. NPDC127108]|uniref:helix-turn-helix domain-containing protein n=1 Tax=Streptomyces sp. NPDC127108 TaxID=3345361 RepID=UPI0036405B24
MPARHFDGPRLRSARLEAGYRKQADLAEVLGVSRSAIATWESGRGPDSERLPAIAKAVGRDINLLFPRHGAPDLADLRCDAGYAQYEIERRVGGKDAVGEAERGIRRLAPDTAIALAAAYGVSGDDLRAAEDRSFGGGEAPIPTTLAEKIAYLVEHTYPDRQPPSDAEIARGVNAAAGAEVITGEGVEGLRTGRLTETSPVVRQGLSQVFGVSEFFFQPNDLMARQLVEGLRTLKLARAGRITHIAARGLGPEGLSADVLAVVNDFVDNFHEEWDPVEGGSADR